MQLVYYPRKEAYLVPQAHNLDGIPINIYEENSARNNFSELKWTLFVSIHVTIATTGMHSGAPAE